MYILSMILVVEVSINAARPPEAEVGFRPQGQIIVRINGGEGRAQDAARALLYSTGHRPSKCNVGQVSLDGHGHKYGSKHEYLIIAWTGQRSPMLYKSEKEVNGAARQPKSGPAKARVFRPPVCLRWAMPQETRTQESPSKKQAGGKANGKINVVSLISEARTIIYLCLRPEKTWHQINDRKVRLQ